MHFAKIICKSLISTILRILVLNPLYARGVIV